METETSASLQDLPPMVCEAVPQDSNLAAPIPLNRKLEAMPSNPYDSTTEGGTHHPRNMTEEQHPKQHRYEITREKDGLIIATWKPENDPIETINDEVTARADNGDQGYPLNGPDTRQILLHHESGDSFVIPWALVIKWKWMKAIIKLTCDSNAEKDAVDQDRFTVHKFTYNTSTYKMEKSIVLPELWSRTVTPMESVFVYIRTQTPTSTTTDLSNLKELSHEPDQTVPNVQVPNVQVPREVVYEYKVRYRIDLYRTSIFGHPPEKIRSDYSRNRVKFSKGQPQHEVIPVLEEITRVVLGRDKESEPVGNNEFIEDFVLDVDDTVHPKDLHILSPLLLNALRSIVNYTSCPASGEVYDPFEEGIFKYPLMDLYHYRQELLDFKRSKTAPRTNHSKEYNSECDKHIDILIHYLENESNVQYKDITRKWEDKVPTTTFAGIWMLLKPGSDVYLRENEQLNAYVIDEVTGGIDYDLRRTPATQLNIRIWNLVYNGKVVGKGHKTVHIAVFEGERDITSLPLFPTSFHDKSDGGALRKQLIRRGKKFYSFTKGPTFLEYSGVGLKKGWRKYNRTRVVVEEQSCPWTRPEFENEFGTRPLIVNKSFSAAYTPVTPAPLGHRARVPRCQCPQCSEFYGNEDVSAISTHSDYNNIGVNQTAGLTDHQALISVSHVFGFVLKDRSYDILDLNGLTEPNFADSAIDELVLRPEENKAIIKAIARTYTESDSQADLFSLDFIRGKGEGQIFLLHGPPGTGKTLTAESVAEYTKRPLLSITAADLGHQPADIERNLLRFFEDARAWDAIVLLDEADVYLERRSNHEMSRNSVVSIFLRALDYFEGILFFTTNRVGHFDEAFLSRIHVSIGYKALDDKACEQIWETFFKKLRSDHKNGAPRIEYEYDAKEYVRKNDVVRKLEWNGREIRNAFQTAVALAIADSKIAQEKGIPKEDCVPTVTEKHLQKVVRMRAAFKGYIEGTHEGVTNADLAFRRGDRNDRQESEEF